MRCRYSLDVLSHSADETPPLVRVHTQTHPVLHWPCSGPLGWPRGESFATAFHARLVKVSAHYLVYMKRIQQEPDAAPLPQLGSPHQPATRRKGFTARLTSKRFRFLGRI
ncbi:hypothetical protein KIL84_007926 [Mauremys mutica]|uniref:Uncharacterized protein n=1 Tax=Mauremys mutica TaxID=74926 RepID=A0A9D3X422_9SAUR|nr:hypothetical protein KIL84_007926 [Mauremys mutica]